MPFSAIIQRDGKVVNPAAVSIVARHCGGYDSFVLNANEEQVTLRRQLSRNILSRIVPSSREFALGPKTYDLRFIRFFVGADEHLSGLTFQGSGQL